MDKNNQHDPGQSIEDFNKSRKDFNTSKKLILGGLQTTVDIINGLARECHENAYNKGFWKEYEDTCQMLSSNPELLEGYKRTFFAQRIALIHSELSEALEGNRKDLMDDKLPHRKMEDVEIVDAIIRAFDLAGQRNMPLGEILSEKMGFNTTREYLHGKRY